MSKVTISHDGFARTETVREKARNDGRCDWCGRRGRTWHYGTEPDDNPNRTAWHQGEFCSKSCHDDYHS